MKRFFGLGLMVLLLLSGCSTLVSVRTDPSDAKVKINGHPIGNTPIRKSLSNFDFTDYNVEISKSGYKTLNTALTKEFKPGAFVLGLFLWWPELLWCYGPESEQVFELTPEK